MKKQTKIYPDSVTGESQPTKKGSVDNQREINTQIKGAGEMRKKIRPKRKIPLPIAASRSDPQSSWTQLQIFLLLLATTNINLLPAFLAFCFVSFFHPPSGAPRKSPAA